MSDLLHDEQFKTLEKEYKLLSRFRERHEIDKLSYTILDIETTGLDPQKSDIIEIGAIKTNGTEAVDVFNTLIHLDGDVPPEITRITGISKDMLEGMPDIKTSLTKLMEFAEGTILVAHNADFDISFIKHHLAKHLQKEFTNKFLCTLKIARHLITGIQNYKLGTIANHLQIPIPSAHRAMGDVEVTYGLWKKLIDILLTKMTRTLSEVELLMK